MRRENSAGILIVARGVSQPIIVERTGDGFRSLSVVFDHREEQTRFYPFLMLSFLLTLLVTLLIS